MKLNITLIRNGMTNSGKQGKLIGQYDEMLLEEGAWEIERKAASGLYPAAELVYTSKQLCCRETAGLIYPNVPVVVLNGLENVNLGLYTGKYYHEIAEDKLFNQWVNDRALGPFPGGESPHQATARGLQAFFKISEEMLHKGIGAVSIVTHRIIISSILQRFHIPRSTYADWSVGYGGGYTMQYDNRIMSACVIKSF